MDLLPKLDMLTGVKNFRNFVHMFIALIFFQHKTLKSFIKVCHENNMVFRYLLFIN
jgi:hypothetical protein